MGSSSNTEKILKQVQDDNFKFRMTNFNSEKQEFIFINYMNVHMNVHIYVPSKTASCFVIPGLVRNLVGSSRTLQLIEQILKQVQDDKLKSSG